MLHEEKVLGEINKDHDNKQQECVASFQQNSQKLLDEKLYNGRCGSLMSNIVKVKYISKWKYSSSLSIAVKIQYNIFYVHRTIISIIKSCTLIFTL